MRILLVGQNPKEIIQVEHPFYESRSIKTLGKWVVRLHLGWNDNVFYTNASNKLGKITLKDANPYLSCYSLTSDKIIALGNYASRALKKLNVDHFKLPHPSGLNRKLNDKKWVDEQLALCKDWLNE